MSSKYHTAAINIARDLSLKLIEQRVVAPEQLPGGLKLLIVSTENLLSELNDGDGLWLVRLARDCTVKFIERHFISNMENAAINLSETGRLAAKIAAQLNKNEAPAVLNAARDLSLKYLETGRVSKTAWPKLFEELSFSLGDISH